MDDDATVLRSTNQKQFYLAGFGPPAPVDAGRLVWAEPRDGCKPAAAAAASAPASDIFSGAIVLAERGGCSFVDKVRPYSRSSAMVSRSSAFLKYR